MEPDLPTVFFSETPAVVVNIDEDPIWSPIAGTDGGSQTVSDGDKLMMLRSVLERSVVALVLASAVGCASAPLQKPIKGGDVDQGPESITAARKFLQGRWSLEAFEVFPPGKAAIALNGSGMLNYDEFGNLRIEIRADEQSADLLRAAGVEMRDGTISSDGRTVVDMQHRTLSYVLPGQTVGEPGPGPLAPGRLRHWEVKGDLLYLSTKDEAGNILSTGRWKRMLSTSERSPSVHPSVR